MKGLDIKINWSSLSKKCQDEILERIYVWLMEDEHTRSKWRFKFKIDAIEHIRFDLMTMDKHLAELNILEWLEW